MTLVRWSTRTVALAMSVVALALCGFVQWQGAGATTVPDRSESPTVVASQPSGGRPAMNMHFPSTPGPHPVIVWVHGGSWMTGSKDEQPLPDYIVEQVARRGFVAISLDYRLAGWAADGTPVNPFPAAVDDVKTAIRYLKANAERYDLRADMILLAGQSAGGHLAALAGTSAAVGMLEPPAPPEALAGVDSTVRAVIDVVGISDVRAWGHDHPGAWTSLPVAALLGCPQWVAGPPNCPEPRYREASVGTYLSPQSPPAYLAYGAQDALVPSETHGATLAAQWKQATSDSNVVYDLVPDQGHEVDGHGIDRARLNAFIDGVLAGHIS